MKFSLAKGPFLRNKRSTTGIMLELFAVLAVVWLTSVATYTVKYDFTVGLRAILLVLTSLVTTLIVDVIVALLKGKRNIKDIGKFVLTSYSYVTSIIFALCLPVGCSYYAVVVGSIVATLLGKYVFGGFGYNIFNPAIIGRIFVGLAFGSSLNYGFEWDKKAKMYDYVTGSTVTGGIDWSNGVIPEQWDLKSLLFGGYEGAMGETFTILLVVAAIYLIVRGIINYRLMLSYLLTVTGISFFLGLFYGVDNVFNYTLLQLITGGILFGAVFMITDPVTSPKSMNGKIIYGIGAGAFTMLIRINSDYPEGVMFSIALMNMLTPLIDSCIKGTTFVNNGRKWAVIAAFFVGSIGLNVGFNALYPLNAENSEEDEGDKNAWLDRYTVTMIDSGTYTVSSRGFYGNVELKVYVDVANELITKVEVVSANDHERINEAGIAALIGDNLNLSFAQFDNFTCKDGKCAKTGTGETSFDVVTDSTYSTSAVVGNLKAVVATVKGGAN